MSEKRGSSSFPDTGAKKKMKPDTSSSSMSDSNVKQEGDGSKEGASDPPASAMGDQTGKLSPLTENKPRNQDDKDFSSGSVPKSSHDQDSQTGQPSSSTNPGLQKRTLLYKKKLSHDDVTKFKIMIPLESGKRFIPEPKKIDGKYETKMMLIMDHEGLIWPMNASFEEPSSSYMLWLNWDRYFETYGVEAGDRIFIYYDPDIPSFCHFLVEYEKKGA